MSDKTKIRAADLPEEVRLAAATPPNTLATLDHPSARWLTEQEQLNTAQLMRLVYEFRGSRRELAQQLGWSERTLYRRLAALGLGRRKTANK